MKKVLCVSNMVHFFNPVGIKKYARVPHLTVGKYYNVIEEDNTLYMIINDVGCDQYYQKHQDNFISNQEIRKLKLQKIYEKD